LELDVGYLSDADFQVIGVQEVEPYQPGEKKREKTRSIKILFIV
jgi:hypothetical protein